MATAAKSGFGSTLKKAGAPVAEIKSISHSGHKLNMNDATNMDSPNAYEEFIAALLSGGEFPVEGNYLGTGGQATLLTDMQGRTSAVWVVTFGSTPTATVTATVFIISFEVTAKYNEPLSFKATLKVTGKPAYS